MTTMTENALKVGDTLWRYSPHERPDRRWQDFKIMGVTGAHWICGGTKVSKKTLRATQHGYTIQAYTTEQKAAIEALDRQRDAIRACLADADADALRRVAAALGMEVE